MTCDRCGHRAEFPPETESHWSEASVFMPATHESLLGRGSNHPASGWTVYPGDLCADCTNDFRLWLRRGGKP